MKTSWIWGPDRRRLRGHLRIRLKSRGQQIVKQFDLEKTACGQSTNWGKQSARGRSWTSPWKSCEKWTETTIMNIRLKNDLIRSIHNFEDKRSKWPTLGRKRKLNTAKILDRILYVCKTGCQWSHLPVEGASYKKKYTIILLFGQKHDFLNTCFMISRM